jgi:hypothetical protein
MGIQNFPAVLQPIIQQGFLEREFEQALRSKLAYRSIAERVTLKIGIGETITKTRASLKGSITTPLAASSNTNLDNGLSSTNWSTEQYTVGINMYAATQDLNTVTSRVGIASQFVQNAYTNGEQAARSVEELARNALFSPYMGGNTRLNATLGSANATISVDDIRGFQYAPYLSGFTSAAQALTAGAPSPTMLAVSSSNTVSVLVNGTAYTLQGATPDATNVSTAPNGISGTLTFTTTVSTTNGTTGNSVIAANAPAILRPNGRATTGLINSSDTLTMGNLLDAVALLRRNAVPTIDGLYNCMLDPVSARQLFADPDFKQLFQGVGGGNAVFKSGMASDFLGLRLLTTTEAQTQVSPLVSTAMIRRPIVCGAGALIEGDFEGLAAEDVAPKDALISVMDPAIAMVTREPLDRLQQIIAQSWYAIVGFTAPTDVTTTSVTVPTASNANYKRAVIIEHIG